MSWWLRWEEYWMGKQPEEQPDPPPKSYDIGLISPTMRDWLLDAARRHPNVTPLKKMAVDLLETATPSEIPPGQLRWGELEDEVKKFGPSWTWADVFERKGRK